MFIIFLLVGIPIAWGMFGPLGATIYVVAVILMFMGSGQAERFEQERPLPKEPPVDAEMNYDEPEHFDDDD